MNSKMLVRIGVWALTVFVILALTLTFGNGAAFGTPNDKIRICHATSSQSNPYTNNDVSMSSVDEANNDGLNGHGDHSGDIIPPFTYTYETKGKDKGTATVVYGGQNWDAEGQAIWNNGCKVVVVDPTPTPTPTEPTVEPTPTPTPTEPTPTTTPTEEPSSTPTPTEESSNPVASPSSTPTGSVPSTPAATTQPSPSVSVQPTPTVTESTKSDFDKKIEKANKNKPKVTNRSATITELPKTGWNDNTTWLLILGSLAILIGFGLKRLSRK